jgi:plastocyanin
MCGLLATACGLLASASPASAGVGDEILEPVSYPGMTTYKCRTDAIEIQPGQNLNLLGFTKTCPNPQVVSGPGSPNVFSSSEQGYATRFEPSMVEIKGGGRLVTPSVWDLHLHHVVWIAPDGGLTFAAGEEKTQVSLPEGYGYRVAGNANWNLNYMLHSLNASSGRRVYVTWEIDWVPLDSPAAGEMEPIDVHWLDVAGPPLQLYPVFDAERGFDQDGDGDFVFPDEVPTTPGTPGFEERENISSGGRWTVPAGGATLVFGAGHLHPGGTSVDLKVARDGPDEGTVDGDTISEVKPLFRSDAHYYEPAGAVSWDVSMEATRRDWRISLKEGDTLSISSTYDVRKASWYESMGILPVAYTTADDPLAKDPFDDAAAVEAMYDEGGVLTHGRLPENIDKPAGKDLGLPDPRKLKASKRKIPKSGIKINSFLYSLGGYSATRGFPGSLMRPPVVQPGQRARFTSLDALPGTDQTEQVWHSITSCKAPCNRGAGIGYPLAAGPIKFDSGQLGFGNPPLGSGVTAGTNKFTTPPLKTRGKTYTYFCRIHPFMRGSIRVAGRNRR